jgi:hypothetical protein
MVGNRTQGISTTMGMPAKLQIPPEDAALAELLHAIEASRRILDLPDDWDGAGSPAFEEATWERAADFLRRRASALWEREGLALPVPQILPGPESSIDIHWQGSRRELLINIPSDNAAPITFYGDDYGQNKRKGQIEEGALDLDLLAWLTAAD